MSEQILVACIGNIFFGDDGFGVEVARALSTVPLPDDVKIVDYGIRGLDLTYALLEPWRAVVFVDAVRRGAQPGTLYRLTPKIGKGTRRMGLDPHALDPVEVFNAARSLGEVSAEIYVVGCEPRDLGEEHVGSMELSPEVALAIPEAVKMVQELVSELRARMEPMISKR